jgi:hypothetical protein
LKENLHEKQNGTQTCFIKIISMKLDIAKCNQKIIEYKMHAPQHLKTRQAGSIDDPKKSD